MKKCYVFVTKIFLGEIIPLCGIVSVMNKNK